MAVNDGVFLGRGDVVGPSSATDGAIAVFDGTTGKVIKSGAGGGSIPALTGVDTITFINSQVISGTVADQIVLTTPTINNSLILTSYGSGTMLKYRSDAANHQLEIQGWDGTAYHVHTDFLSGATYNELQLRLRNDANGIRFQFPDSGDPFIQPGQPEQGEVNANGYNLWIRGGEGSGTGTPGAVYMRGYLRTASGAGIQGTKLGTTSTDVLVLDQNDGATVGAQTQISGRIRLKAQAWDSVAVATRQVSFFTEVLPAPNGASPTGDYRVGFFHGSNVPTYPLTLSDGGNLTILNQMQATKYAFNSGSAVILTGNGTPEGANTAAIGSIYLRRDGGASTTLYVKESGASNTGWKAVVTA